MPEISHSFCRSPEATASSMFWRGFVVIGLSSLHSSRLILHPHRKSSGRYLMVIATSCSDRVKKIVRDLNLFPLTAVRAKPLHYQVIEVGPESVFFFDLLSNLGKQVLVALYVFTAFPAQQVMVVSFLGMMKDMPVAKFAFKDTPVFLQKVQSPVNSWFIDPRHCGLNMVDNLLCRQVS